MPHYSMHRCLLVDSRNQLKVSSEKAFFEHNLLVNESLTGTKTSEKPFKQNISQVMVAFDVTISIKFHIWLDRLFQGIKHWN